MTAHQAELTSLIEKLNQATPSAREGLQEELFLYVSRLTPLVNVDLLIRDPNGGVLLTWRRDEFYEGWHVPGGIIRFKETALERIKEVARLELGLTELGTIHPLSVCEKFSHERDTRGHFLSLLFEVQLVEQPPESKRCTDLSAPESGQWSFFSRAPDQLLKQHDVYRRWFVDGAHSESPLLETSKDQLRELLSADVPSCRVCGVTLPAQPLLSFTNMPSVAQNMPTDDTVAEDRGTDFGVYSCEGCGLVQLDCEPVPYFRDVIRAAGISQEMTEWRERQFAEFVDQYSLRGRSFLEVGCGRGEYLRLLSNAGLKAVGIEHGEMSLSAARDLGLSVEEGFITEMHLEAERFSGAAMFSFLEHLPEPVQALRKIRHTLEDGAPLLIEVPNFDMILEEKMATEFMTDHLTYFTQQTLRTTLNLAGFDVVSMEETWHRYLLTAVAVKRRPPDLSEFARLTDALDQQFDAFLKDYSSDEVAIWGAGHQALATISLHSLAERCAYVVDSAEFKQGHFTPATHLKIHPPHKLKEDERIRAVIVMGASYSDEIARIIRADYSSEWKLGLLRPHGLEVLES